MAMIIACLAITPLFASCEEKETPPDDPDAPAFTAFSFAGQRGASAIDAQKRTVKAIAECGTDIASLAPEFTLAPAGATATVAGKAQASGETVQSFAEPVTYVLAAANGKATAEWTVTVILPDDCPPPLETHTVYFDEIGAHHAPNIEGNRTTHIEMNMHGTGIDGIEKEDITVTPAGALTGRLVLQSNYYDDENEYLLVLYPDGVSKTQTVTVTFQKEGYTFIPSSRQVQVKSD